MNIDEFDAPGLSEELLSTLKSWGISHFTDIQKLSLDAGVAVGSSLIVCSPTSSGKTLVGEIAIFSALQRGHKCLYLVSHKALADQKYVDFEKRIGESSSSPIASVGLSTGDRDEGEVSPQLLISTYEKALALLLSGQLDIGSLVVVADELQIIGEENRGPNIETLCAIFRQQDLSQFIALTATIGNANELADWLRCKLVESHVRDVELHQEIWFENNGYSLRFGQEQGTPCHIGQNLPADAVSAARQLVGMGRGPVLVFTESRREASDMATQYCQSSARTADGVVLAEQLELFSEPTESSEQLQQSAQKRVAFHTADLTAQERQVIENGFDASSFDVCFATTTLAAGVNFPFKSVVFPKLTYQWGARDGQMIARSDYRNMSGRAGRLGLHPEGFAVLLPKNQRELTHANTLILPENDHISSNLVQLSMRRAVLAMVSFGVVNARNSLTEFFQHSFYWHQIEERNPRKLEDVVASAVNATDWLVDKKLLEEDFGLLMPTPVGKTVAQTGLLPATAVNFLDLLAENAGNLDADFESYIPGLVHSICNCEEFKGRHPSRFLPYPSGRRPVNSHGFLRAHPLLGPLDRTDDQTNQCAHALILFSRGEIERAIRFQTNIPSGQLHRLATDVAWVVDGLRKIASVPELNYPQTLTNKLSMLARQIQWGVPAEALDILRVAQRESVPGFGRQRAAALLAQGIQTFDQLLSAGTDILSTAIGNQRRISALLTAVAGSLGFGSDRYKQVHVELARKLGFAELVEACALNLGTEYENSIEKLLQIENRWKVTVVDDGKQQNVPDLMISLSGRSMLIECKTTTKKPPLIKKEEAFAVLQKAIDYDKNIHRVTLGKPKFDEHSKKKVQGASDVSIVEHDIFVEGILRLHAKQISPEEFFDWLIEPGLVEIERLGGKASYELLQQG